MALRRPRLCRKSSWNPPTGLARPQSAHPRAGDTPASRASRPLRAGPGTRGQGAVGRVPEDGGRLSTHPFSSAEACAPPGAGDRGEGELALGSEPSRRHRSALAPRAAVPHAGAPASLHAGDPSRWKTQSRSQLLRPTVPPARTAHGVAQGPSPPQSRAMPPGPARRARAPRPRSPLQSGKALAPCGVFVAWPGLLGRSLCLTPGTLGLQAGSGFHSGGRWEAAGSFRPGGATREGQ